MEFIKKPSLHYEIKDKKVSTFLKEFFVLLFKVIFLNLIIGIVFTIIIFLINPTSNEVSIDAYSHNLESFINSVKLSSLWIILLGPIYEEVAFRLGLNFKKRDFIISILLIVFISSGGEIIYFAPLGSYILETGIRLCILIILFFVFNHYVSQKHIDFLKDRYAKYIIYLFSLIFGVLHITNYFPFEWDFFFFYLMVISIVFILAMALSYVRIKYGLMYAIIFHSFWNSIQFMSR